MCGADLAALGSLALLSQLPSGPLLRLVPTSSGDSRGFLVEEASDSMMAANYVSAAGYSGVPSPPPGE